MEVTLNLEEFDVRVLNQSADIETRGGYQHPHVNSNGEICWNGHDDFAKACHHAGDFLALRDLIGNLLGTYNPSSPYITLEDWENGLGNSCEDCGERYSEDDLIYVEYSGGSLCPDCRYYCERCDQYVHYRDYECNPDNNWEMCNECAEEHIGCCTKCDERFRNADLHVVEIVSEEEKEVIHLCEDCYLEHERKEEEDANYDDAEGVLAPAMAMPSHA